MPDRIALRVTRRYVTTSLRRTAVLAHVDRDGVRWGWFSDNTPRMHLEPFDSEHRGEARVWLEDGRGVRSFQIDREPVDEVVNMDALRASVARTRSTIEAAWIRTCALRGWIDYSPADKTITLYGGSPDELVRSVRSLPILPEEMQIESGTNTLYVGVKLNRVLWRGRDDGSDSQDGSEPDR